MGILARLKEKFSRSKYVEIPAKQTEYQKAYGVGKVGGRTIQENIERNRILQETKRNLRMEDLKRRVEKAKEISKNEIELYKRYKQRSQTNQQSQVSRSTALAMAQQFGSRIATKKQGRVKYGRGRPKGSYEGKYAAYGGVFGYRKFIARQKAMQVLRQQQMMQQIREKNPQLAYQIETGQVPMPQQTQQMPQIQQQMPPQPQVQQQPYQNSQPREFNALNVPNTLAGASLNNPAPRPSNPLQFNLGFPMERPITNPGGEWFTETDWMTGKQVLRRRNGDKMFQW